MSIKAKSSNLPPLNGLIPFDQSYGKKGNDRQDVEKFTHKNEEAIEKGVATTTDATMPRDRLDMLARETGNLRITKDAHGLQPNELLLVGNDFKTKVLPEGKDFHFIAVENGGNVTIYAAKQDEHGAWKKDDEPIQVMANRDGKAVTADYDLALVAPRVKDLGPQHMSSLKMASFAEVDRRTRVVERMTGKIEEQAEKYTSSLGKDDPLGAQKAFDELGKLLPIDKMSETEKTKFKDDMVKLSEGKLESDDFERLGRQAAQLDFYGKAVPEALKRNEERYAPSETNFERARNIILGAMAPPTGEAMSKEDFLETFQHLTQIDLRADGKFESIVEGYPNLSQSELTLLSNELGSSIEGTGYRDTGIVSSFVRDLVPDLNQIVGQTGGREVFHHGDDVGNPYSVEKDNFPMTVILPEGATRGGDQIRVVMNADDFLSLAKDLKRQGYSVPFNEMWDSRAELFDVRTESFTEARNAIALQLGGSVQEMIDMANLQRKI